MAVSEPLPHFADDLLGYLHETHPTYATLDGVHIHDDLLEDLSRHAIDAEARALSGYSRRLDEIASDGLTPVERLEQRMLSSNIRGRMFELEEVRTWERNPQYYADLIASSLAGQALFTYAPAPDRARRRSLCRDCQDRRKQPHWYCRGRGRFAAAARTLVRFSADNACRASAHIR